MDSFIEAKGKNSPSAHRLAVSGCQWLSVVVRGRWQRWTPGKSPNLTHYFGSTGCKVQESLRHPMPVRVWNTNSEKFIGTVFLVAVAFYQ